MNMLRSMHSNEVEEEVRWACSACVKSACPGFEERSTDHLTAIRGLLGAAAGVEPEVLLRMKREMEKLRKLFNETQPEVEKATRNVEELISKHFIGANNKPDGRNDKVLKNDLETNNSHSTGTLGEVVSSKKESMYNIFSFGNLEAIQEDSGILGSTNSDCVDGVGSLRSIKSKIESMVEQEMQRVKNKKELILSEINEDENKINKCTKNVDCLAVYSDGDSGDEINVEESRLFLEAFKADTERTARSILSYATGEDQDNMGLYTIEESENSNNDKVDIENKATTRLYFPQRKANVAPNISEHTYLRDNELISDIYDQRTDQKKLSPVASTWWSTDESVASDILQKLKQAVDCFSGQFATGAGKSTIDKLEIMSTEPNITGLEITIEQVASILSNITVKIDNICSSKQNENAFHCRGRNEQLYDIAKVFFGHHDYAVDDDLCSTVAVKDEHQMMTAIKEISETFSIISERLNNVPAEAKQTPMSIFDPPQSFTKALVFLASTEYFGNCFTTVLKQGNINGVETSVCTDEKIKREPLHKISDHSASESIRSMVVKKSSKSRIRRAFPVNSHNSGNLNLRLDDYEHYLGLSPTVLTVENFSHMLLLMSSVLNDFPSELKSVRFFELNPPSNLVQGLGILYTANDIDGVVDVERDRNFASLTLQDVSDFALTLSKVFYDAPLTVKKSTILDLTPPKSLLTAVKLLTSLLCNSALESCSQDEVEVQEWLPTSQSQDNFFDAVDSVTCLNGTH